MILGIRELTRKLSLRGFFRNTRPIWEIGLGTGLWLLLMLAAMQLDWIEKNVPRPILVYLIMGVCFGFYLIRRFFRLAYGTVEILIGLSAIFGAMGRSPQIVDNPATNLILIQLAAGMYVVIRGLDNFAQAAPFAGGSAAFRTGWELIRARWRCKRTE